MPGNGTGYVSVTDYLNANQGTLDRERAAIQQYVGGEGTAASQQADALIQNAVPGSGVYSDMPGYSNALDAATRANTDATAAGTQGGVADLLQRLYGGTADAANTDAGYIGAQQQPQNDLTAYLNQGLKFASRDLPPDQNTRHPNKPHGDLPTEDPMADPTPYQNPDGPGGGEGTTWTWQDTGGGG